MAYEDDYQEFYYRMTTAPPEVALWTQDELVKLEEPFRIILAVLKDLERRISLLESAP